MPWHPVQPFAGNGPLKYSRLQSRQIRVLKLHHGHHEDELQCELIIRSLDFGPEYEALSYVVGPTTETVFLDCCDGYVQITPNLEKGLRRIRRSDRPRIVWTDQVSINQSDIDERSVQVQIMGDIFKEAQCVIMWLGPAEADSKSTLASDFIRRIVQLPQDVWAVEKQITEADLANHNLPLAAAPEWEAFNALLSVPYWTRVWIYQEIQLAQDREMLWGSASFSWESFCTALKYLLTNTYLHRNAGFAMDSWTMEKRPHTALVSANLAAVWSVICPMYGHRLHALLKIVQTRSAADARDKVYGILGLLKYSRDWFTVDYSRSLQRVFTEATIYLLQRDDHINFLGDAGLMNSSSEQHPETWPSWVPCWGGSNPVSLLNLSAKAQAHLKHQASLSRVNPDVLNVTGIILDRISHISEWYKDVDESIQKSYSFFIRHARRSSKGPHIKSFLNAAMCGNFSESHDVRINGWSDRTYVEFAIYLSARYQRVLVGGIASSKTLPLATWRLVLGPAQAALLAAHNCHPADLVPSSPHFTINIAVLEDEFWREHVEGSGEYAEEAEQLMEKLRPAFVHDDLRAAVKMFIVFRSVKGDPLHFFRRYHQTNQDRELFVTEDGTFGMGPKQLQQPGDLVVIFGGYRAPCIIRPIGDQYRLLGDCYFEGAMYGEKVRQLESRGKLEDAQTVFSLF